VIDGRGVCPRLDGWLWCGVLVGNCHSSWWHGRWDETSCDRRLACVCFSQSVSVLYVCMGGGGHWLR